LSTRFDRHRDEVPPRGFFSRHVALARIEAEVRCACPCRRQHDRRLRRHAVDDAARSRGVDERPAAARIVDGDFDLRDRWLAHVVAHFNAARQWDADLVREEFHHGVHGGVVVLAGAEESDEWIDDYHVDTICFDRMRERVEPALIEGHRAATIGRCGKAQRETLFVIDEEVAGDFQCVSAVVLHMRGDSPIDLDARVFA
jgi:hypothetical protein